MAATIKILGTNSDHDTCNRCGKTNLKKVVWIEIDGGEPEPIGCECAARLVKKSGNKVWSMAHQADEQKKKDEKNKVNIIGENRSVVDWYVSRVYSSGQAVVLCRANGSRKEVEKWAESKYSHSISVDAPAQMGMFSKVEW